MPVAGTLPAIAALARCRRRRRRACSSAARAAKVGAVDVDLQVPVAHGGLTARDGEGAAEEAVETADVLRAAGIAGRAERLSQSLMSMGGCR